MEQISQPDPCQGDMVLCGPSSIYATKNRNGYVKFLFIGARS